MKDLEEFVEYKTHEWKFTHRQAGQVNIAADLRAAQHTTRERNTIWRVENTKREIARYLSTVNLTQPDGSSRSVWEMLDNHMQANERQQRALAVARAGQASSATQSAQSGPSAPGESNDEEMGGTGE